MTRLLTVPWLTDALAETGGFTPGQHGRPCPQSHTSRPGDLTGGNVGTPVRRSPDAQDTGRPLRETLLGTVRACLPLILAP